MMKMNKYIPALMPSAILDLDLVAFVALNTMLGFFCANNAWFHGALCRSELNTWRLAGLSLDCPLQDMITHWMRIQKKQKHKAVS